MRKETPLSIPEGTSGSHKIRRVCYPPGYPFTTANPRCALMGGQRPRTVKWPYTTTFHELSYEGGVWMTDLPCEQAQHKEAIRECHGRVLVGGLGIGLAVHYLLRSPRVRSVTVIEISEDVVQLIRPSLPRPRQKHLQIITADLMEWIRSTNRVFGSYNSAFFDIWQSDGEGTFLDTVVPLRRAASSLGIRTVTCWNEDVMRGQLFWSLQTRYMAVSQPLATVVQAARTLKAVPSRMPTIEDLASPRSNDKWLLWSAPFFRAIQAGLPVQEESDLQHAASTYAKLYEIDDKWEARWDEYVEENMP